jgi:hypothetical protein
VSTGGAESSLMASSCILMRPWISSVVGSVMPLVPLWAVDLRKDSIL